MRRLTENEIKFFKETNFTPTVFQLDSYAQTPFKDYAEAIKAAKETYNIDLDELLDDCSKDNDSISLEYEATYLLYTFFTKEELEQLSAQEALDFLQNFKYFGGFRKWDLDFVGGEIQEAIEIYDGRREFQEVDGSMWNCEKDD